MRYAELTDRLQREGFDCNFVLALLKDLGYTRPLDREYSEADLRRIREEAIIRRHEARKGMGKGGMSEMRIVPGLAQAGLWFRATPYRARDGFVEPSPKAEVEEYRLDDKALEKVVADLVRLGENVQLVQEKKEVRISPESDAPAVFERIQSFEDASEIDREIAYSLLNYPEELRHHPATEEIRIGPESEKAFLDFYDAHGPLGLHFRDVWRLEVWPFEGRVMVKLHPTLPFRKDLREHFGEHGYEKYARWTSGKTTDGKAKIRWFQFDMQGFLRHYREHGFPAALEVINFSLCARRIIRGEPDGLLELRLRQMEEAFLRSRPSISYAGGPSRLELSWRPNSLLDAAYLHLFKATLEGEYRICKDPKCGKLFKVVRDRGRPREYCSNRCTERHVKERQRSRQAKPPPKEEPGKGGGRPEASEIA